MTIVPEITLGQIITSAIALLGLVSLVFAYIQLRLARANSRETARATKARFVLDLNKWFNEDEKEKAFFYRLDYSKSRNAFLFNPETFPHSEEERHLDTILYKLSHVGALLSGGIVGREDLTWIKFIVAATLRSKQVQEYLQWLKSSDQVPDHSSFADAITLYEQLFGSSDEAMPVLRKYLGAAPDMHDRGMAPDGSNESSAESSSAADERTRLEKAKQSATGIVSG